MRRGFTLIELLVAITILIVGILGVTQMVAQGMTYNVEMRHLLTARHLLERRMELFELLKTNDPSLVDPENDPGVIDYDDLVNPDHQTSVVVDGLTYNIIWNVVVGRRELVLDDRFRTAKVFVRWQTTKDHRISNYFVRWEER